jgi:hypothetical protein
MKMKLIKYSFIKVYKLKKIVSHKYKTSLKRAMVKSQIGSFVRSPRLGIIWNDHMGDFALPGMNNLIGIAPFRGKFH